MEIKGYLQQRNNKWYYRLKYVDEDGIKRDIMRIGGKTKAEANSKMTEKIAELQAGAIDEKMTFKACYDEYIKHIVQEGCKKSTINNYNSCYNNHLCKLDNVKMCDLRQGHIVRLYGERQYTNYRVYSIAKSIYRYAYKLGVVRDMSLFDRLDSPKKPPAKQNYMQIEDFKRISDYLYSNKSNYKYYVLYLYIMLAVELGTRRGELCGLTWDFIDFANRSIRIKHNLVGGGRAYVDTPKTITSNRVIYFGDNGEFLLKSLWQLTSESRLACLGDYKEMYDGLNIIGRWQDGSIINPNYFSKKFQAVQRKLGFDKIFKIHDLRHLNASLLISAGVDIKSVQQRLGHTNVNTTLNIYSHVVGQRQEQSVDALEKVLKSL